VRVAGCLHSVEDFGNRRPAMIHHLFDKLAALIGESVATGCWSGWSAEESWTARS